MQKLSCAKALPTKFGEGTIKLQGGFAQGSRHKVLDLLIVGSEFEINFCSVFWFPSCGLWPDAGSTWGVHGEKFELPHVCDLRLCIDIELLSG